MNLKQPRVFIILPLLALAGAAAILAVSCSKGSGVDSGGAVALSSLTPIANCIVDSSDDVEVGGPKALPGCDTVVLEPSAANPAVFGAIDVEAGGTLEIGTGKSAPNVPTPIVEEFHQICIDGGTVEPEGKNKFEATNTKRIILKFVGDRNYNPPNSNNCEKPPENFRKGIDVMAGGTLILTGAKGVPSSGGVSWTTLAAPAGSIANLAGIKAPPPTSTPGRTTLYLTADVTKGPQGEGWQDGDWIVVATTDYVPYHSEFVQIDSVHTGSNGVPGAGSWVTLKKPLEYYHFGSLAPSSATASCPDPLYPTDASAPATQPAFLCDGPSQNYGVDERAEVGLISRDLTLTAKTEPVTTVPPPATSSVHWGGEIKIHAGFQKVVIQGVRISKFGKDQLGSYPIHFHQVGPIGSGQEALVDADSVDHSYNKCVTIHSTANLTISNLVCARIVGHIFYEEFNSKGANNPAGNSGIVFNHDLGIGAMSNSFDIYKVDKSQIPPPNPATNISRAAMIAKFWWVGDYMTNDSKSTNYINYDGFNIPDTDNQMQDIHGRCWGASSATGEFVGNKVPPCDNSYPYYIEPASGFWIQNQQTELVDDAIAGCQGLGTAYWWVVPAQKIIVNNADVDLTLLPFGTVKDDRASGCYHAYFSENEGDVNDVAHLYPTGNGKQDGSNASNNIIATFDGLNAAHNRYRALWLRPTWYVIKNSQFADNNRSATMLTSGGVDGNAPGVWQLLKDSVLVGESQNNVERWGPCPAENLYGIHTGAQWGCIDYSHPGTGNTHSGELIGKGYPYFVENAYGYLLYDGPALLYHDRFVNFNRDDPVPVYTDPKKDCHYASGQTGCAFSKELDKADVNSLIAYSKTHSSPLGQIPFVYEGDAALGWFPSNQSPYPTATASKQLLWVNSNLRHQIFTEHVAINKTFNDSDKNTAIIDEDGTLDGYGVKVDSKNGSATVHPISLNNLPFNSVSNAVDECYSRGAQNALYEGRDSSLISPAVIGTLEFSSLYPWMAPPGSTQPVPFPGWDVSHWQKMTFTRTDKTPNGNGGDFRPSMSLLGRAGRGLWEPKVASGYGYTVTVAPAVSVNAFPPSDQLTGKAGLYKWLDVGLSDIVDPNASKAHPFFIRLGIDYASIQNGAIKIPANNFIIQRGYKSYYNGFFNSSNQELQNYWRALDCNNIDVNNVANMPTDVQNGKGYCPAPMPAPAPSTAKRTFLQEVGSIAQLTKSDGTPNLGVYFYNTDTGYLWLNIAQDEPNAQGPSPLGSCSKVDTNNNPDPDCPYNDITGKGESFYACPAKGCIIYTIEMNDPNYVEGPSPTTQLPPAATSLAPAVSTNPNQLVLHGTETVVTRQIHTDTTPQHDPYYTATNAPNACTITQPPNPGG